MSALLRQAVLRIARKHLVKGIKVYVNYDEDRRGGGPKDGEDTSTPYYGRKDVVVNFRITGVTVGSGGLYSEEFLLPVTEIPDYVWVVVVRYSSGDTFGHTRGNGVVIGVHLTREEAVEEARQVKHGNHPRKYLWSSFFGDLEDVEISEERVRG